MVIRKKVKKATAMIMVWIMLIMLLLPNLPTVSAATSIQAYNDPVQSWPASFTLYTDRSGEAIYDPANEAGVSPDDVDFTSGAAKGSGDKPSFYAAGDGSNLFFRVRLLGDPRDDKGGFLSSVWQVQILQNGVKKATVGVDGKSPSVDYIYVANANGSVTKYSNKTDSTGSNVPGTRVTEDTNGDYFLDFQVPISRLTEIDSSITSSSILQFSYATSKAANLTVVNKDAMSGTGAYVKASPFAIYAPTISISSLASPYASTLSPTTISGTTTNALNASQLTLTISSTTSGSVVQTGAALVTNNAWTVTGLTSLADGSYVVTASVVNEYIDTATTSQKVDIGAANITINGAASYSSFIFPTTFSGIYTRTDNGTRKVNLSIYQLPDTTTSIASQTNISANGSGNETPWASSTFTYPGTLVAGKTYRIEVVDINNSKIVAIQTIKYVSGNIAITAPANNTRDTNAKPTVKGTADPDAKVGLYIDNVLFREVTADGTGAWSVDVDRALSPTPSSYHVFKAVVTDDLANPKQSTSNYGVDALDISIENGSHPYIYITNQEPTIRGGSTDSLVNLTVTDENDTSKTFSLSNISVTNNKWSIKVPTANKLTDNTNYVVTATAVHDPTKTATLHLRVKTSTSVAITSPTPGSPLSKTGSITGTSEPNADIDLNIDSSVIANVKADTDGEWSYTPSSNWTDGTHNIVATTADIAGNTATAETSFEVGTTPITNLAVTGHSATTADVSFTAPTGATVVVLEQSLDQTNWSPSTTASGLTASSSTAQATGLTPATKYYFRLEVTSGTYAGTSNVVNATTDSTPIANLAVTGHSATTADVSFTAPTGATVVVLEQSLDQTNWSPSTTASGLTAASSTAQATGLTPATKYYFRLVVTSGTYAGTSNVVNVTNSSGVTGILFSSTGGFVSGIEVNVKDTQGTYISSSITDETGRYTINNLPSGPLTVYVANSQRTLISESVTLTDNQVAEKDLHFLDLANISLSANPEQLVGDGKSTSELTATLIYKDGNIPVSGANVKFAASAGSLSVQNVTTNSFGIAASTLTAPTIEGIVSVNKSIDMIVRDLETGIFAEKTVTVTFLPASIEGIVTVGGQPIDGATVTISEDFGPPIGMYIITATTGPDGRYSLVVPLGNRTYIVKVTAPIQVEDQTVFVSFEQKAVVGSTGQGEAVSAISQISGKLFVKGNTQKNMNTIFNSSNAVSGRIFDVNGLELLDKPIMIEPDGRFKVEELPTGTYRLLFQLTVNGEKLAGIWKTVKISANGEIAIEPSLIDPYGIVRDSLTNDPIPGIDMQLYWADTPLNRGKGRTPDTIVNLPILPEFAPNQNRNSQTTTAGGEYAWMVFANGDYYLKGVKTGYTAYDSRVEGRNVPSAPGEDSQITNGIIHVGETIIKYDLSMTAQTLPAGQVILNNFSVTPTSINLTWNTVVGAVYYSVYGDGQFLGNVTGVTYSVNGLTSGTTYQFYVIANNDIGQSDKSNTVTVTTAAAPVALNVSVSGTAEAGRTLTGSYLYRDVNDDPEGLSVFQWYRADNSSGSGRTPIPGATGRTYMLEDADIGKFIGFEVTPISANGSQSTGIAVQSAYAGPITESDASINDDIKDALKKVKVGFTDTDIWESVTKRVFLVKDGANSTDVSWITNNENVLKIAEEADDYGPNEPRKFIAQVNRQSVDVSVIATATVKKGNGTPLSRTFLLIVKSNAIEEQKVTKARTDSSVVVDEQTVAVEITRTTLSNSKQIDKLIVSTTSMEQLLQINKQQDVLSLKFNDKPNNDLSQRADELAIEIPISAIEKIGSTQDLQVATPEGSVGLTAATLSLIKDLGIDLFFRIVPIRDQAEKQEAVNKVKQDIAAMNAAANATILDIPREIETNYTGFETEVTLPLSNLALPLNATELQSYLDSIRVLIQHSDGTKEVVGGSGNTPRQIVYENGQPAGIKFKITKFSTFTFFQETAVSVKPAPVAIGGGGYIPSSPITVASSEVNQGAGLIEVVLSGAVNYYDEKALQVIIGGKVVEIAKVEISNENKLIIHLAKPIPLGYMINVKYDAALAEFQNRTNQLPAFDLNFKNGEIHYKYMNGYPDGKFKPENAITRAEMAAILARLLNKGDVKIPSKSYPDVSDQHWASSNIEVMMQTGIMKGYDDGTFKPEQFISRGEFAAVVLRFMNQTDIKQRTSYFFPDIADHWSRNEIETIKEKGIMLGNNGLFYPNRSLSRNEAVTTLNRVLKRGPLTGDFSPSWPDVPTTNWGYGQVEEASRTHEFTRVNETEEQLIRFID